MKAYIFRAILIVGILAVLTLLAIGLPGASAQTPPVSDNIGAFFQMEGGERIALSVDSIGDNVAQLTSQDDGSCDGDFSIELTGSIERVRVRINEDCSVTVANVVPDRRWGELVASMDEELARSAAGALGWKWEVRADAEFQGLHPVNEMLTRSRASVKFKTASLSGGGNVYDGENPWHDCHARYGQNIFFWVVDNCIHAGFNLDGPTFIWSETLGYFHNTVLGYPHSSRAKAGGKSGLYAPDMFYAGCSHSVGPPHPAHFECILWWNLIGYS